MTQCGGPTRDHKVLVNAFRSTLYTPEELLGGFRSDDVTSYASTLDFEVYRGFIATGRMERATYAETIIQSLHDNSISFAMRNFLDDKPAAAIMGGHRMPRSAPHYADVARIARTLTRKGILVCSGGGPGAMEATHLGAAMATQPDSALDSAIALLATVPDLPDMQNVVDCDGNINEKLLTILHEWSRPAFEIWEQMENPGESLAIPTWHYGHEPPTPFATHIAKYFQNSLREDGLLAIATQGIIYTDGRAGTLQEVFQDAAQNYYRSYRWFSPMVFFGSKIWQDDFPVIPVLEKLFEKKDFSSLVLVTDNCEEAAKFVMGFVPPEDKPESARPPSPELQARRGLAMEPRTGLK
jgi:predicted Rossmann-fold nucleotide-binding protein